MLLLLTSAAFVIFLPADVDVDYGAAGRAALGVVLAWIACLPALTRGQASLALRNRRDLRLDVAVVRAHVPRAGHPCLHAPHLLTMPHALVVRYAQPGLGPGRTGPVAGRTAGNDPPTI